MPKEDNKDTSSETFEVKGEDLLNRIKELLHEGNIRRITIKSKEGNVIAQFPLTFGVVGTLIAPILAAIGAITALVTDCSITIEKNNS